MYIYREIIFIYILLSLLCSYNITMPDKSFHPIINKINKLQVIVQNVIRSNQLYKTLGFIEANDLNSCITYAETIF